MNLHRKLGLKCRVNVLDQDLTIKPVNGRVRIVQDERQNKVEEYLSGLRDLLEQYTLPTQARCKIS